MLSFRIGFPPPPKEWRDCFGLTLEDFIGSATTPRGTRDTPEPGLHAPTIREYGNLEVAVQRLTGPEALGKLIDEHGLYSVFKRPDGSTNLLLENIRGLRTLGVTGEEAFAIAPRLRSGILVRFTSQAAVRQVAGRITLDVDIYVPSFASFWEGMGGEIIKDVGKLDGKRLMRRAVPVTQTISRPPIEDSQREAMPPEMRDRLGGDDVALQLTTSLGSLSWSGFREKVLESHRFGKAEFENTQEEESRAVSYVLVWDGNKKEAVPLKAKDESRDFLQFLWDEERERLTKLRGDVITVLSEIATDPEASNLDKVARSKFSKKLAGCLSIFNEHLSGVQVTVDIDGSDIHVVLNAPSLEAATFTSILLSRTKDWEYRQCERKNCGGYFPAKDPRKKYCDAYCQRTKHKEERDELERKKDALRAKVYRRKDAGELGDWTSRGLIETILEQEDMEQLDALEKKTKPLRTKNAGRPPGKSHGERKEKKKTKHSN